MISDSKNVLIISTSFAEHGTECVIDWLMHFGYNTIRINSDQISKNTKTSICYNGNFNIVLLNDIFENVFHSIWFRRWEYDLNYSEISNISKKNNIRNDLYLTLVNYKMSDSETLCNFLINNLKAKIYLTKANQIDVNKLDVLLAANEIGLRIPKFLLTNSKSELLFFKSQVKKDLVSKVLDNSFSYFTDDNSFMLYTELLTDEFIQKLDEYFVNTFFQEKIEKKFDLRIFFLNNKISSMAILSQSKTDTKIDWRKGYESISCRKIPFKLPTDIELNIMALMNKLKLNIGLIDMVLDRDDEYFFLEVNPVGQFMDIAKNCNYPIELEIANYLINGE